VLVLVMGAMIWVSATSCSSRISIHISLVSIVMLYFLIRFYFLDLYANVDVLSGVNPCYS
jgi:hypothetical protein